jgi:lysophospholipase L1-like esterase
MRARHVVVVLLFIALLASLGLNYFLYARGESYYRQIYEVRLDPLGLSYYPDGGGEPLPEAGRETVVFFGDSRAYDWPPPPGLQGYHFVNRGIGNETSVQAVARFERHVALLEPDVVVIETCINDLKTIPIFAEQRDVIVERCKANVEALLAKSRAHGARVVLVTVFPLGRVPLERRLFWSDEVGEAIVEVNAHLRSLAGDGVVVLDSGAILAGEAGRVCPEYSRDLLHLNSSGYEVLNAELARVLRALER